MNSEHQAGRRQAELPRITIIMPTLNQAAFLAEAIESVLGQDYPALQLIVMDGGSTDGSLEILRRYESRLALWRSEPDRGQSDALNKGFRLARGDIIGWLNSDDTYAPGAFRAVALAFSDPATAIAMCSRFGFIDQAGAACGFKANSWRDRKRLIRFWTTDGMTINQPCVFMRRSLLNGLDPVLDDTLHYAMDYDLWLRLTEQAPIRVVEGHWANYRYHPDSKTVADSARFFPEWRRVSRRYWGQAGSPAWIGHCLSYLYWRLPRRYARAALRRLGGLAND